VKKLVIGKNDEISLWKAARRGVYFISLCGCFLIKFYRPRLTKWENKQESFAAGKADWGKLRVTHTNGVFLLV